jgi:hypothetical protein
MSSLRSSRVSTRPDFLEGRNVVVEYRWAEGDYQRLPAL